MGRLWGGFLPLAIASILLSAPPLASQESAPSVPGRGALAFSGGVAALAVRHGSGWTNTIEPFLSARIGDYTPGRLAPEVGAIASLRRWQLLLFEVGAVRTFAIDSGVGILRAGGSVGLADLTATVGGFAGAAWAHPTGENSVLYVEGGGRYLAGPIFVPGVSAGIVLDIN